VKRVVVGATDPNPKHGGRAFKILARAGIPVAHGVLAEECARWNEAFNHWIVRRTPFVTIKAAMSLDGKIATVTGQSKWITSAPARAFAMKMRAGADAILVGVNTIVADDPSLTVRAAGFSEKKWRRLILDPRARTPLTAKIVSDEFAHLTTVVATKAAPAKRLAALERRVRVLIAPERAGKIDLRWLLRQLGREEVTSLLVEGGGETNAAWLPLAQRVTFFYAPLVLGGRGAPTAIAGEGVANRAGKILLREVEWRRVGPDLLLTARLDAPS
jgi:diaminohydroxyphosphoribosylaminopyrimidine deaminase/5-amino-6-(5-phosphoribosylamino)uracil reductase